MRVLICDDNRAFAVQLRSRVISYCTRFDYDCTCTVCCSAAEVLKQELSSVQILFLDIDMPGLNGIDLARRIRRDLPELILIFVTSWIQYAPSGYEVSAFRYLLKEHLDRDFEPCMNDTLERLNLRCAAVSFTEKDGTERSIPVPHILYLEGTPYRHIYVHTVGAAKPVLECMGKLADYVDSLSGQGFLRIQRSFLVNMQHIRQMKNYVVFLSNGEMLQSSKKYFSDVRSEYTLWKAEKL